jgi:hypothetical protein
MMAEMSSLGGKHNIVSRAAGFESNFLGSRDVVECGYSHRHQRCQGWISSGFISTVAALRCRLPQLWNSVYVWLQLGVIQLLLVDEDHIILASLDSFDLHDYFHMNAICVFSTLSKLMLCCCRRFTIFSRILLVNGSSWFVVVCLTISRDRVQVSLPHFFRVWWCYRVHWKDVVVLVVGFEAPIGFAVGEAWTLRCVV